MTAPSPAPLPDVGAISLSVWHGVADIVSRQPVFAVIIGVLAAVMLASRAQMLVLSLRPRDPVRLFSRADKAYLLRQAGGRCEQHTPVLGSRCRSIHRLEADHIRPWSRGGRTVLANGQILCQQHNRAKNATVPMGRSVRRLADRRARYPHLLVAPTAPAETARGSRRSRRPASPLDGRCAPSRDASAQ